MDVTQTVATSSDEKTKIVKRLKRLEGQVRALQRMVEEDQDCKDILVLLKTVRGALNATSDVIVENYLSSCYTHLEDDEAIADLLYTLKLARG